MPKYAIVVTSDARYIAGVNGQLNAMRYYGMDNVEYHLLHTFPDKDGYIEKAQAEFPFLKPTQLDDFMIESGRWKEKSKRTKSIMKYVRWWYPADKLGDYDAICILDADRQIVNNFERHFDMIAKSDMIGLAKNDYSEAEWFSYKDRRAMQANPPLYSNPYFISGRRCKEIFPLIPKYAENPRQYTDWSHKPQTGDMHPVNLTLLHTGMIKDVFPLPATQWVFVETTHVKLAERIIGKKRYIGIHDKGDLLYTFHRKFWGQRECERFMNGHGPSTRVNGVNNTWLFWKFTHFFNTELYLKLDWIWGDFPSKELSPEAKAWLDRNIRSALNNNNLQCSHTEELELLVNRVGNDQALLSREAVALLCQLGVPALAAMIKKL